MTIPTIIRFMKFQKWSLIVLENHLSRSKGILEIRNSLKKHLPKNWHYLGLKFHIPFEKKFIRSKNMLLPQTNFFKRQILFLPIVVVCILVPVFFLYIFIEKIDPSVQKYNMTEKQIEQIIIDLQSFGERRSWEGQLKASNYIQGRLIDLEIIPQQHVYNFKEKQWINVFINFSGTEEKKSKIIVIAHYDSSNRTKSGKAPGAEDNGSGVAALLNLAQIIAKQPLRNDVQLVFFSNEEYGKEGSKTFAKKLTAEGASVIGILNIDAVGYNDPMAIFSTNFLSILSGDFSIKRKVKMISKLFYNIGVRIWSGERLFMIAGRNEDKHLKPATPFLKNDLLEKHIKWKFADSCA